MFAREAVHLRGYLAQLGCVARRCDALQSTDLRNRRQVLRVRGLQGRAGAPPRSRSSGASARAVRAGEMSCVGSGRLNLHTPGPQVSPAPFAAIGGRLRGGGAKEAPIESTSRSGRNMVYESQGIDALFHPRIRCVLAPDCRSHGSP